MDTTGKLISLYTLVRRDFYRIVRIWPQTLLPSLITSVLYFLIFGSFLGSRIGEINGVPYISFVIPGLIMLAVITNSYSNVAFVMFTSKFFNRTIDEILVSPTPPSIIVAGLILGGIVRGVLVGILVLLVSLFFSHLTVASIFILSSFLILTSLLFSLGGLINGVYAKSIDGVNIVPTFVLTPLVYLGGVFYSTNSLTGLWQTLTHYNPIFYIINGFRHGFLGFSDVSIYTSFGVLIALNVIFAGIAWYLIKIGLGLKQ